jgi:hypothetical protein
VLVDDVTMEVDDRKGNDVKKYVVCIRHRAPGREWSTWRPVRTFEVREYADLLAQHLGGSTCAVVMEVPA